MAVGFPAKTNFATGDVLTATNVNDITGTLNLLQSTLYPAGRNKIINGDFGVNQRAFTSTTTDQTYGFDRWQLALSGATATYSAQTFTAGAAPVSGYEGKNFARLAVTVGNDNARLQQAIEDVRTFAGQTVVMSFWAKGTNPTTAGNLSVTFTQNFGSGGSPSSQVSVTPQTFVLTANWTRYSLTFDIPSISGKTIGTTANTSYLAAIIGQGSSVSSDAWTLDLWGVQLEAASTGSTASPFQTASGSIGGELALCQRYYFRNTVASATGAFNTVYNSAISTTHSYMIIQPPVPLRTGTTAVEYSALRLNDGVASQVITALTLGLSPSSSTAILLDATVASSLTAYRPYFLQAAADATAYIGFSAEL